ncbi:MAG: hypothetical protein KC800_16630 [Candidatus Eremiobacteraeota bacterium]|nr:hypothetical protein [Candidatus Eremiobacteraeota bacterium]
MKYLSSLALAFSLLIAPALADIEIGDIVINRTDASVNVRVNMHNPGPSTARSPIMVRLYVQAEGSQDWREVKSWSNITKLAVGHRVARDYFNDSPGDWDPAFNVPSFTVRATATSADGRESFFEQHFPSY